MTLHRNDWFSYPHIFHQPAKTSVSPRSSLLGTFRKEEVTQRQKFHTDDVKSVRNPVRSADWLTEQLHCFSYCLRMTDKRQKATKVKCKHKESLTKQSIFLEYSLLQRKHLSFAGARRQMNTTLHQSRPEDMQNWTNLCSEPHDYWILYVNICIISIEFLSLSRRCSSLRNVPSSEERGETDVFAG